MERERFLFICEEIRKKRQTEEKKRSYEIGERRQKKMISFLQELKKEKGGIIHDFLQTGDLSFQDVAEGIDFFIVCINSTYKFYPLSVTGERWVEEHKRRHPENLVISITESDTTASVKIKIMEERKNKGSLRYRLFGGKYLYKEPF